MRKSLLSATVATALLASASLASAQTTTTTQTWTNDQGTTFREYSTTKKYTGFNDPAMRPTIGMALPDTVTIYPLPDTMKVETPDRYSYGMINNNPVVVERTTRKVVHSWE